MKILLLTTAHILFKQLNMASQDDVAIAKGFDAGSAGQAEEQPHGLVVNVVLRVVNDEVAEAKREATRAITVLVEQQ